MSESATSEDDRTLKEDSESPKCPTELGEGKKPDLEFTSQGTSTEQMDFSQARSEAGGGVESLKYSRSGYLAHLSKLYRQCEMLMLNVENYIQVEGVVTQINFAFYNLIKAHGLYSNSVTKSESKLQADEFLFRQKTSKVEFDERVDSWLKAARASAAVDNDTMSHISDKSVRSFKSRSSSSRSSTKLHEAKVRQAVAALKLQQMDIEHQLVRQQQELQLKTEKFKVEGELNVAKLEYSMLEDDLESDVESHLNDAQHQRQLPKGSLLDPEAPVWSGAQCVTEPVMRVETGPVREPGTVNNSDVMQVMAVQVEAYKSIASALKESTSLPRQELQVFEGDPTEYWRFVKNFEACTGELTDDRVRLNLLIQHCKGEPKKAIQDCVIMEPTEGYHKARDILKFMYGRPHVISQTYIQRLVNGPLLKASDSEGLTRLGLEMQQCEIALTQMGYMSDLNNTSNLLQIVARLPMHMRTKWADRADSILEGGREPTFQQLTKFVLDRARVANTMYGKALAENQVKYTHSQSKNVPSQRRTFTTQGNPMVDKCKLCDQSHHLFSCGVFSGKSNSERRGIMRRLRLCDNCAQPGHIGSGCLDKSACNVENCRYKHHTLLHYDARNAFTDGSEEKPNNGTAVKQSANGESLGIQSANCHSTGAGERQVCLKVVPVRIVGANGDVSVDTYALLDECSDVSLCSQKLVDELGIQGTVAEFDLTTVNQTSNRRKGLEVSLVAESLDGRSAVQVSRVWTVDSIPVSSGSVPRASDLVQWSHLDGLNFTEVANKEVTLLIGADTPDAFWVLEQRRGKQKDPYAVRTPLGWTLIGPVGGQVSKQGHVNWVQSRDLSVKEQLERMWNAEFRDLSGDLCMSMEEKRALEYMESTVTLTADGHYQLALPWRQSPPALLNNRSMAEARLQHLKRRLSRDDDLRGKYQVAMQDYISKGHASKVPVEELVKDDGVWYLPHHPVQNEHKPHKVRVVFDCAATFSGTSLNEQLLKGPDLTNKLVGVLMRFRESPVALMADVEGMFSQVRVSSQDRDYLRFLWWPDGDMSLPPEEFRMNVHLFGASSSPSCANFCLRKVAMDQRGDYDESVVSSVERNFYVDDYLGSVDDVNEGQMIVQQLPELLSHGAFRLIGWVSNAPEVLAGVPDADRARQNVDLDLDHAPVERALGIKWDVLADQFWFESVRKQKATTRRGILSVVSSLFDPLGVVGPLTLPAKVLLQDLCREQHGWDEAISEQHVVQWQAWLVGLERISELRVPRCLVPEGFSGPLLIQLHHFADASQVGYGAVSYLRVASQDGVHCSILLAKSRVAPLKAVTIPRLELAAAVVAVDLDRTVKQELDLHINQTVFWTDSTAVLQFIKNESRRFHTFVANRVSKIHESSDPSQWRHVGTSENPADHASRGLSVSDSDALQQWLKGPEFLWGPETRWPETPKLSGLPDNDPEVKQGSAQVHVVSGTNTSVIAMILDRCSSWFGVQKCVAWLRRYQIYCRQQYSKQSRNGADELLSGPLKLSELQSATSEIIRHVQQEYYPELVAGFSSSGVLTGTVKDNALRRLSPVLVDGLLSVGGRLERAPISADAKNPIILPKQGRLTDMIIRHYHEQEGHCGRTQVLATVRQKFWVVSGQSAVRRVLHQCIPCKKRNATLGGQMMAPLPGQRLIPDEPPFTRVGVDYFGPFLVKIGRSQHKRYGCIFTCMSCRAVHLEIAHTLDSDSFICALQRFISRRGRPRHIFSDNGTNFKGGDRELREALESWNTKKISDYLQQRDIEWSYNPPAASHMGGVWERLIRSVRQVLRSVLKEQLVTDETLVTMFAEVERILNDRPLTPLSDDATDLQPLTPSHILLLTSNSSLPPAILNKEDGYGRRRWRQAQYLAGVFWRRWLKEYLPTLQIRQKWTKISRNFSAGDLVLVSTDSANRGQWPLGRITEVFPDVHGHVRSARVRTAAGSLLRPVTCLCLLEDRLVSDQIGKDVETANVIKSDQQEPQEIKSGSLPEQVVSKSTPRPVRDTRGRKPNYLRDFVSQ